MERTIASERVYKGKIINVRRDMVLTESGREVSREVVEHPGAVAILAVDAEGRIALVRQYRYAVAEALWEVPAGKLEPGEDPAACAERELAEETGYKAENVEQLTCIYSTPGFCNEKLYLFYASLLEQGSSHAQEDEAIRVGLFSREAVLEKIRKGDIRDAKTIAAMLWYTSLL
ncbi:MAG: NUDIX hydrolase [Bacillota bacterium]